MIFHPMLEVCGARPVNDELEAVAIVIVQDLLQGLITTPLCFA